MTNLGLVSLSGLIGVLCRYGTDLLFKSSDHDFPVSTLLVNLLGSFLAGAIYAISETRGLSSTLQTALLVGFCGGFTTFSAYTLQTLTMLDRGKIAPALCYFVLSPVLGLLAAFLPVLLARKFLG